ncbi:MAG: efflux RND transporter periplasmic adaptor subunit [Negativicutes bacterium]
MTSRKKNALIILLIAAVALGALIGYRIYSNIQANKAKALATTNEVYVSVGHATRREILPTIKLPATIEAAWSSQISSKVDGRIILMNVNVGDHVVAGQTMCQFNTDDLDLAVLQAQANLLQAQANADNAESNFERTKYLYDEKISTKMAFERDKSLRDASAAQMQVAAANLKTMQRKVTEATIVAPHSGVVVERKAQEGYYAKAGESIFMLADDHDIIIKKNVPEGKVSEISIGMPLTITVDAVPGKKFFGKITRIYPSAILPTRTYTSEATIDNNNGTLHMGMSATVEITGNARKNVLCVPERALIVKDDQKSVFIVLKDNIVKQTVVEIGALGGGWAEILSGITEADTIVLSGQNKISDGDTIKISGEGAAK